MIPDYSIQEQKKKGRTRKPELGVTKERSSHLEVLLEDVPPELCRPLDLSHSSSTDHKVDVNSSSNVGLWRPQRRPLKPTIPQNPQQRC
jgi:hypothetical protein